jgi:hypothetical protein
MPEPTTSAEGGTPGPTRGGSWSDVLRRPPVGVLVLGGLLAFLGAGFVVGAAYFTLAEPGVGWVPLLTGAGAGPLALYVAIHLIRLTHWAWLAMVLALALLLASSLWRLAVAPPPPVAPVLEIVVELLGLAYLTRPGVRGAFARR